MTDFSAARKNMVDSQIHTAGIIDEALLEAFRNVPRETFVPPALQNIAYTDEDLAIGGGRFLPEPSTHARMIQAVQPTKDANVLDIGGSTGYSSAIMSSLVSHIYALEEPQFLDYAAQVWGHMGMNNIIPVKGLLPAGNPDHGPYDIIYINGAVAEIPVHLTAQLAPHGRMVAIIKKPDAVMGQVTLVVNSVGNKFSSRVLFEAGGHYLPGFEPQPVFVFNN